MGNILQMSFDYSNDPAAYFQEPGPLASVDLSGKFARTGIGCYINAGQASAYVFAFAYTELVMGCACNSSGIPGSLNRYLGMENLHTPGTGGLVFGVNSDLKYSISTVPDWIYVQTNGASGLPGHDIELPVIATSGAYDYLEWDVVASSSNSADIKVQINGFPVPNCWTGDGLSRDKTNVTIRSVSTCYNPDHKYVDCFTKVLVEGGGLGYSNLFDDLYVNEVLATPNNSFAGPVRIYTTPPTGDGSPLAWSPSILGQPHYKMVAQIGSVNDAQNVTASNNGDTDMYTFSTSGIPSSSKVIAIQATARSFLTAAGSHGLKLVASFGEGDTNALSTSAKWYNFIWNDKGGTPFIVADIAANQFGQKISDT